MTDSIFTKIIKGEIPCYKIYEDDKTIAFLDIHPVQPGHALIVPKKQINEFQNLPDEDYKALFAAVKKVSKQLKHVLGVRRIGLQVIGIDVPHAHVHLIPFDTVQEFRAIADMSADPDHAALADMAKKLAF